MAGLDSIKHFEGGGTTGEVDTSQGAIQATMDKSGKTSVAGKIALDPTQTEAILTNMQKYIDERQSPMNLLMGGINRAYATTYGPSALTAHDQQKNIEDKQIMDYRSQMAAYRAAQSQATNEAARYAAVTPGAGAGAGAGAATKGFTDPQSGVFISPEQLQREFLAGPSGQSAARQEYLKAGATEKLKRESNVELDKLVPYPINGREELIPLRDATELAKKNPNLPRNQQILVQASKAENVPAPSANNDNLLKIKNAVFATESTSGKADTTKPGIQGAMGPMQITPETWDTNVKRGIIPKDYDINNPVQNKEAGNRLLDYYYKQYNGDIDKTFAAYHGGEGAINADGTINLERKDKLGTSIGDYITKNKAAMGLTSAPATIAAQPTLAEIQANRKIEEERGTAGAKKYGESGEAMRTAFENDTDPGTLDDSFATSRRIQTLVKNDPTLSGVINQPGIAAAVAGVVQKGIGNFGIADLENAIYKALPTTTQQSLGERSELISYLAKIELQTAKLIKGQGQITEGEREILQRASSSINDPAELIYKKARALERITRMNEELASVYGNNEGGKYNDFRKFKNDPEFKRIHKEFRTDLENILNEKVSFNRPKVGAAAAPKAAHPEDIQAIINRNKPKAP